MSPAWLDWPLIFVGMIFVLIAAWLIRREIREHPSDYFLMAVGLFWFLPQFEIQTYYWPWIWFPWCVC